MAGSSKSNLPDAPLGKPWFHPKPSGFGAELPCSWEGWVAIGVFAALMIAAQVALNRLPPGADSLKAAHVGLILALVGGFIFVVWGRTSGGWHWRWKSGKRG